MRIFSYIVLALFLLLSTIFTPLNVVYAEDFKTDYVVDYYIQEDNTVKVKFKIDIHHISETYIKKFSLTFPKVFAVKNVLALYNQPLTPTIINTDSATRIELPFDNPTVGSGMSSSIYLEFEQENLFKVNGEVWEIIIP